MSDLNGLELPVESGWYMPTGEAPDGFWNPYYLHPDGSWMEAGFDGYTTVDPGEIQLPIDRLVFAAAVPAAELAEARAETSRWLELADLFVAARHGGREEQQKADALIASQMTWPGRSEASQAAEDAGEEIAAAILAAKPVTGTV